VGYEEWWTDIVEGSAPCEVEKADAHGVRARYVGKQATAGVVAHCRKEK
jgi:hypothetical protein